MNNVKFVKSNVRDLEVSPGMMFGIEDPDVYIIYMIVDIGDMFIVDLSSGKYTYTEEVTGWKVGRVIDLIDGVYLGHCSISVERK